MKIKEFYLYGCSTQEEYDKRIGVVLDYVPPVHIIRMDKFTETPGFLPYIRVRVNKKTWKKLKEELDLCKITC